MSMSMVKKHMIMYRKANTFLKKEEYMDSYVSKGQVEKAYPAY